MENYEVNGHTFLILGIIHAEGLDRPIPMLAIRMMSDERERELMRKGATA